ncbi:MAG: ComF family protein [Clostridium sp.]|nr:ComF family protein [Clostridium sp.]
MKIQHTKLRNPASALLDALFPRRCPVCGTIPEEGRAICPSCLSQLSFVSSPVCKKCGKEMETETMEYCLDCTRHKRSFAWGVSLLNYNEAAAHSMAAIKYKNKREYLDFYAEETMKRCKEKLLFMEADVLVPVPVHPARRRQRGFNQAELLAQALSVELKLPVCSDVLRRTKKTEPQKDLTPSERLKNLEEAFEARAICGRTVLLVDDIYTTGSTIEACTRALLKAGAKKVCFFTLCIGQGQ